MEDTDFISLKYMSFQSTITIKLESLISYQDLWNIYKSFIKFGWFYDDHGHITYLPKNDDYYYDWEFAELDKYNEIESLLLQKLSSNEEMGIVLTWKETGIGCSFHFNFSEKTIWLSILVNRQTLKHSRFTDFSWYLDKIIEPIKEAFQNINYLECEDIP